MAEKVFVDRESEEIKKVIKSGNFIIGSDVGMKSLKLGKTEKVYLASNCNEITKKEAERLARIAKVDVVVLSIPNDDLGVLCKKPFSISMLSVVRK
jgi:large subunit ribosomal protein L30e